MMDTTSRPLARLVSGLAGRARRLESHLEDLADRSLRRLTRSRARDPVEIAHAIVDAAAREVLPSGRDQCLFPFNDVRVLVVAADREARARYEAVFDGDFPLRARILERLQSVGCAVNELGVTVVYAPRVKPGWIAPDFHLAFDRVEANVAPVPPARAGHVVDLTVVRGDAEYPAYSLSDARIDLGRCAEIRDSRQRLIRTNHVAFADTTDAVNQSVSRRHAHIERGGDALRLYDDGSAQGTSVMRLGRTIPVPPGKRGIKLLSGDEILLGDARLEVRIRQNT